MAPRIEAAKAATFETDDKRAQYARLVVFNHGVKEKIISKDKDANSVSQGDLQKAFKSLTGGTLLKGKEGIALIQELSRKGSGHPEVEKRGLTTAYAQEVRPFILRGTLSATFGRRSSPRAPKTETATAKKETKTTKTGTGRKKTASARKTSSRSRGSRSTAAAPAGDATEAGDAAA